MYNLEQKFDSIEFLNNEPWLFILHDNNAVKLITNCLKNNCLRNSQITYPFVCFK